mgnify:CR=1
MRDEKEAVCTARIREVFDNYCEPTCSLVIYRVVLRSNTFLALRQQNVDVCLHYVMCSSFGNVHQRFDVSSASRHIIS